MSHPLHILAVAGSLGEKSSSCAVLKLVVEQLRAAGCEVDLLDLHAEPLAMFSPDTTYAAPHYAALAARVARADVLLLATPDYHGSLSSALKNFLDHCWKEFAGKLFAAIVASHEKGLTVHDQLRTIARQCYAWSLPYGVSFADKEDVQDGRVVSENFQKRLAMLVHDVRVYGELLARQRRADLAGKEPGFLARHRK